MASLSQKVFCISRCISALNRSNTTCNLFVRKQNLLKHWSPIASFSTSGVNRLKQIVTKTEGNVTEIKAEYVEDPAQDRIISLDAPHEKICPLCPHRLKMEIKYTDVLILSQFLRPDGCILPSYVTGCCAKAQTRLEKLVHKAQRAGLMPELRPDLKDGKERTSHKSSYKWRRYNIFYND